MPFPYGVPEDWSETDHGHHTIYKMEPELIPAGVAARTIYELRLDVERLNREAMDYWHRLKRWEP